jgi:hypothetical protein
VLSLEKAREEAKRVLADLRKGIDPKAGRRGIVGETLRGRARRRSHVEQHLRDKARRNTETGSSGT